MFSRFLRGLAGAVFQAENFKQGGPIKCAPGRSCGNLDKLTVYRKLESKKKGMLSAGQLGVITIMKDHKAILVYPKSSTSVRNTVAA